MLIVKIELYRLSYDASMLSYETIVTKSHEI